MKDYWFPWYPDVFAADTMHLTLEQECIYRRLIDHYMRTRTPLPDNDHALARISGTSIECFMHASSIVRAYFKHKNGILYHAFCDAQLDIQDGKQRRRSEISSNAAKKRWKQNQELKCIEHSPSIPEAMLGDATGQDRTRQDRIKKKNAQLEKPPDVDTQTWDDFKAHRKTKRASLTETVVEGYRREADKAGISLQAAIETSITNGWQGFKADWILNKQTEGNRNGKSNIKHQAHELLATIRSGSPGKNP